MNKAKLVLLILTIPIINMCYKLLNNSDRGVKSLVTDIDKGVPFISAFVIPYILWYVFIFSVLIYLMNKDEKTLVHTVLTIDICLVLCYIIYFNFQTTVPRPLVTGDNMLSSLVNMVYSYDQPFNCFPSIHCLTSYIMMKAISKSKVRNLFNISIVSSIAVIIILSTMFIKQHVILDVISAIILGDSIFKCSYRINKEKAISWIRKQYLLLMMKRKSEI